MNSTTKKFLIVGGLLVVGYIVYTKFVAPGSTGGSGAIDSASKQQLLTFVPNDPVWASFVASFPDAVANGIVAWNNEGRPQSGWTDPVIGAALNQLRAAGGYFS